MIQHTNAELVTDMKAEFEAAMVLLSSAREACKQGQSAIAQFLIEDVSQRLGEDMWTHMNSIRPEAK